MGASSGGDGSDRRRGVLAGSAALALALAAGAIPATAGAATPSAAPSNGSAVQVGFVLPLTGNFAANAKLEEEGFKLGIKELRGTRISGHRLVVHYADSHGTPATGLSVATALVTSTHVDVMEGPLVSSTIAAVSPYVIGKKIPEDDLNLATPTHGRATTRTPAT